VSSASRAVRIDFSVVVTILATVLVTVLSDSDGGIAVRIVTRIATLYSGDRAAADSPAATAAATAAKRSAESEALDIRRDSSGRSAAARLDRGRAQVPRGGRGSASPDSRFAPAPRSHRSAVGRAGREPRDHGEGSARHSRRAARRAAASLGQGDAR